MSTSHLDPGDVHFLREVSVGKVSSSRYDLPRRKCHIGGRAFAWIIQSFM